MTDGTRIFTFGEDSEGVRWQAVMQFDENTWRKKKYKRLSFNGIFRDATLEVSSDNKNYTPIAHINGEKNFVFDYPLICEMLFIRLSGTGQAEIRSIEREWEVLS